MGQGNHYVLNPGAKADRVAQNDLAGWSTTGGAVNSTKQSGHSGRWAFAQSSTKVTVSGIAVTNGSIQVGVFSDANAGNWVNVDDFGLVQNR
nr:hypothetical protein [Amycolatopsis sp. CA-128772]